MREEESARVAFIYETLEKQRNVSKSGIVIWYSLEFDNNIGPSL